MKTVRKSMVAAVLILLAVGDGFAQAGESNYDFLNKRLARMIGFQSEFNDLSTRFAGHEDEVVKEMYHQAEVAGSYLSAMCVLVDLHEELRCDPDRERTWRRIKRSSAFYVNQLDLSARLINSKLSLSKNTALIMARKGAHKTARSEKVLLTPFPDLNHRKGETVKDTPRNGSTHTT